MKGTTVAVSMLTGDVIQGVMVDAYRDAVELRGPRNLSAGEDMGGRVMIPRDRIDFYQEAP